MSQYDLLRTFADSWGLLLMVLMFLGVVIFTFRPGSSGIHAEIATLPLRNEKAPDMSSDKDGGDK